MAAADPDQGWVDIEAETGGRFSGTNIWQDWDELLAWWNAHHEQTSKKLIPAADLTEAPVFETPSQIFGIGLNYKKHAAEIGAATPAAPMVFTKFQSCLTGPNSSVKVASTTVDYEAELVVVIGRGARSIKEEDAWSHVAGLTVGQDFSDRVVQNAGSLPQFSFAKSYAGYGPVGPYVVSLDELSNPDDLALGCSINGDTLQNGRTSDMIFAVPALISYLSEAVELAPGDLIFTGTPEGVGQGRSPQRYLIAGDQLSTWVEGVGEFSTSIT